MDPAFVKDMILQTELFQGLDDADVQAILSIARVQQYPPGETLLEMNQSPVGLLLLLEGSCRVEVEERPDAPPDVLADMGPGEVIGEFSFLDNEPVSARVRTRTQATLLWIPHEELRSLMVHHPSMERKILWNLCLSLVRRLRHTNQNLVMARRLLIKSMKSFRS